MSRPILFVSVYFCLDLTAISQLKYPLPDAILAEDQICDAETCKLSSC